MSLVYCDYIADVTNKALKTNTSDLVHKVGGVEFDLNEDGSFRSSKKTIPVVDINGKKYKVTIEEL